MNLAHALMWIVVSVTTTQQTTPFHTGALANAPTPSTVFLYVDKNYTGGGNNGTSTNPYTSIANAMTGQGNSLLTAGTNVYLYVSACDPTCTTEEATDGFSSSQRTSTGTGAASTAILTIDGMSKYQTNATHSTPGGATWVTNFVPPSPPAFPGENYAKTLLDSTSGLVNTSGTAITWQSSGLQDEPTFNTQWSSRAITINSVGYTISSCSSTTSCTLTSSAGTQTGVAYTVAPILKAQMTGSVPLGSTDSFSNCKGFIVYHGLDVANNNGQTADLTYIHDMTLEYSELHRIGVGSGGPGVYIGPGQHGPCHSGAARPSGTDSGPDNVTVQYNHVHETWGECIYDGANSSDPFVANASCTSCQQFESGTSGDNLAGGNGCASNSLVCATPGTPATGATGANHVIQGNTIESCAAWGGQEDGSDIKDGHANLQILGNTYAPSMTPPCMTAATPCTSLQCKGGNNAGTACTSNATCTGTGGYCGTGNQGGRGIVAESCTRITGNFVRLSTVDGIDVVDSWNTSTGRSACQVDNNIVTNINSGIGHNNGIELEALNVSGLAQWGNINFLSNTVFSAGNYATNTDTCMTTSPGALSGTLLAENNIFSTCGIAVTFGTGTHDYNNFFAPTTKPSGEGAHSITTNPTFASSTPVIDTDFFLQVTSGALGAGVDLSALFTTDYFGNTRTVPFSIGGYQ